MSKKTVSNNPVKVSGPNNSAAMAQVQLAATSTTTIHQGPLPSPEMLAQYDNICPGAADRIISMAEGQAAHRQSIEGIVIRSRARDSFWGIVFAFLLALATIISGTHVILNGFVFPGTLLGTAGLVGLVGVFIYGTRESRKEREQKMRNS
jgi:uncharacterized membrane protein